MVSTVSFNELDIPTVSYLLLCHFGLETWRASNACVYRGIVHEDFNIELHTKIHLKDMIP